MTERFNIRRQSLIITEKTTVLHVLTEMLQQILVAENHTEVVLEGVLRGRAHLHRKMQQGLQPCQRDLRIHTHFIQQIKYLAS